MVLGELDWYMKINGTRPQFTPYTRVSSKWIKNLNINCDMIKSPSGKYRQ